MLHSDVKHDVTCSTIFGAFIILYSGYNLRGAISAKHQISHLEVIFAIVKLANHGMVYMARSINAPAAY